MLICEFDINNNFVRVFKNLKSLCYIKKYNYYKIQKICTSMNKEDHFYNNSYFYNMDDCYILNGEIIFSTTKYLN